MFVVVSSGAATLSDSESTALLTSSDQDRSSLVPPAAQSGSIAGRIADIADQGLPGVSVIAIPATGGLATRVESGVNGIYRFDALATGTYRVDFDVLGFDLARRNNVAVSADRPAIADATLHLSGICECVTLVPKHPLRERAGQVLSESGHPLPHARLQIGSPWPEVRYADAQGRFVVRLPISGRAPLTASSSGFRPVTEPVSGTASAPIVFRLVPDRTAKLADSEQLTRGCRCPGDLFTHPGR